MHDEGFTRLTEITSSTALQDGSQALLPKTHTSCAFMVEVSPQHHLISEEILTIIIIIINKGSFALFIGNSGRCNCYKIC